MKSSIIEKTENKKGYKKTKLGWIPEEWEVVSLGKICNEPQYGLSESSVEYNPLLPRYIRITDINEQGELVKNNKVSVQANNYKQYILHDGDILFARTGATVGKTYFHKSKNTIEKEVVFAGYLIRFIVNEQRALKKYVFQYTQSPQYDYWIKTMFRAGAQPNINSQEYSNMIIPLPSKKEQEKIAEILSAWDDGIETLEKLIEQQEVSKKAIMQKLFLEKESWKMIRFDKIFKDFCKKNCPEERLLSATQENGVIPRDMLSGKVMSPEGSLEGYKLIEAGDFVISLRSFQGGLEYSKYRGILSPAYTVLKNIINIDKDFYRHFFKSYKFIEKYLSISVIGIRDGKQISYSDLSSVKIPYPPLEEQEKIGKILNCCDEEIQILNFKLEKLKEQKKGLMQKLLTGQIRVKV